MDKIITYVQCTMYMANLCILYLWKLEIDRNINGEVDLAL